MGNLRLILLSAILSAAPTMGVLAVEEIEATNMGSISGRVTDTDKNTLPGATIFIEDLHTGAVSDINGFYTLSNLKPGTYSVKVSYVGYSPIVKTVTVKKKEVAETNIVLNEGVELQEVQVKGAFSGQRKALQLQKSNMGVTNVVSADQVGKFPDSNIGDALKRINGINVQYDQGEARFGQIRGTSADLTSVTVNGNRMPSAEGDTRNVQLDLIPADMIQTIEVSKVLTADMDGDAIGGSINLVTKNSPNHSLFNITAGTGYTWVSDKMQWNLGATWGDRFFNDKLGIMASLSYQYAPGGSDNAEFEYTVKDDALVLTEAQTRQYYVTRERQSYSLSLDYEFNPLNKIGFKAIYNRRNDWENRYRVSYKKLNKDVEDQSVVVQTKAGSSDNKDARLERQQTMDFTLDGEHYFGIVKLDWAGSFSRATEERPEERYMALKLKGSEDYDFGSSIVDAGTRKPYSNLSLPSYDSDAKWKIDELTNQDEWIEENEWKAKLNMEIPLSTGLYGNKIKFGYKYTRKEKSKDIDFYDYTDVAEDYVSDWANYTSTKIRSGFFAGDQYVNNSIEFVDKSFLGALNFDKADGVEVLEEEAENYEATEQIHAGYIRFDQQLGKKLDATLGLRLEHTRLATSGVNYTLEEDEDGEEVESLVATGEYTHNYTNLLPSLLLRYKVDDDTNIRASVTKSISRPKYSALVANKAINLADEEATIGNPETDPTTSWNFDLSADYYFKSIGLVSVGLFYKDIKNVNVETIGYYIGADLGLSGSYADTDFEVEQNMNAYDARIFGVEVAFQRDFGFICPALRCLGFYGNYTYTHSSTHNYNDALGIEEGDDVKMAGSPEHTANASLYFEKSGLSIRLSYNFASSFIDEMNTDDRALDVYYDKVNYLDLNASYTWGKKAKFTVYAEATNLLNQPLRYYYGESDVTKQMEYYGVKLTAGLKVNL